MPLRPPGPPRTYGNHRNLPRPRCFAWFTAQRTSACHNAGEGWDPRPKIGHKKCMRRRQTKPRAQGGSGGRPRVGNCPPSRRARHDQGWELIPPDSGPAQPPRVDKAPPCAKGVGLGSKVFCLNDLPFPPAKQHPTSTEDGRYPYLYNAVHHPIDQENSKREKESRGLFYFVCFEN